MHSDFTVPICQRKKYYKRLHAGCNENIGFGSFNNTALSIIMDTIGILEKIQYNINVFLNSKYNVFY